MSVLIMGFVWGMAGLGVFGTGVLADIFAMEQSMGFLIYLPSLPSFSPFSSRERNFFPKPAKNP